ncbi:MAG: DUF3391 domain-containing protein [Chromatiales bacterium]|nr:DUF3391 domain-containing protein [Chromatiales bacterium]
MAENRISLDRLVPGVFVRLELDWHEHDFLNANFVIQNQGQIEELRRLGVTEIAYDPKRSTSRPLPAKAAAPAPAAPAGPREDPLARARRERKLKDRRHRIQRSEEGYRRSMDRVKHLMTHLGSQGPESVREAGELVNESVDAMLADQESVLHLMSTTAKAENLYFHALNVMVLSLILGRKAGLNSEQMRQLGLGALFHDVGKARIPYAVCNKETPLTRAEEDFFRQHPSYGVEMAAQMGLNDPGAVAVIRQHHEHLDGSGYPRGLKTDAITVPARIVAIVNAYDELCNQRDAERSSTPHEALSQLYRKKGNWYDDRLLAQFVQVMGVYPPGTIAVLSNERIGMVLATENNQRCLRPPMILYDPDVPKESAPILEPGDDPDIVVVQTLRPLQLSEEVFDYLNPQTRLSYYFDAGNRNRPA